MLSDRKTILVTRNFIILEKPYSPFHKWNEKYAKRAHYTAPEPSRGAGV